MATFDRFTVHVAFSLSVLAPVDKKWHTCQRSYVLVSLSQFRMETFARVLEQSCG